MHTVPLPTLQDTLKLASKIAKLAKVEDVITLRGELGAGKTAFARAFIQSLNGNNQEVPSPTFTLYRFMSCRNLQFIILTYIDSHQPMKCLNWALKKHLPRVFQ